MYLLEVVYTNFFNLTSQQVHKESTLDEFWFGSDISLNKFEYTSFFSKQLIAHSAGNLDVKNFIG